MVWSTQGSRPASETLRLFASQPLMYSKMMAVHTGETKSAMRLRDVVDLSLRVLAA